MSLLFARRLPRVVVVQGDTTTALAGALAANACDIPVVHVEAGLRSYDRAMPEEHNRVLVDHVAEVCCAPTVVSRDQLLAEGIAPDRVVVTGNTVVEAVHHLLPPAPARRSILIEWGLRPGAFTLATFHRPENVDGERLESLLGQLQAIVDAGWPVVLPLHPRTRARLEERHLGRALEGLTVTRPLDYPTFLGLAAEAGVLLSDSGGLQEEATVLKRPIVVVRNSTERPEAIGTFARRVPVGNEMSTIALLLLNNAEAVRATLAQLPCPFGDGRASRRCATAVRRLLVDVGNAAHCPVARASTALEPSASIAPGFRVSRRPTPFTPTPPARSAPE